MGERIFEKSVPSGVNSISPVRSPDFRSIGILAQELLYSLHGAVFGFVSSKLDQVLVYGKNLVARNGLSSL